MEQWRKVFLITSCIYFFDAVFYVIFASAEEQAWNREYEKKDKKDREKSSLQNDKDVSPNFHQYNSTRPVVDEEKQDKFYDDYVLNLKNKL